MIFALTRMSSIRTTKGIIKGVGPIVRSTWFDYGISLTITPRIRRVSKGNLVYHVGNRANGRLRILKKQCDLEAFEGLLAGRGFNRRISN